MSWHLWWGKLSIYEVNISVFCHSSWSQWPCRYKIVQMQNMLIKLFEYVNTSLCKHKYVMTVIIRYMFVNMILHSSVIPLITHLLFLSHNSSTTRPRRQKFPLEEVMLMFVGDLWTCCFHYHREYSEMSTGHGCNPGFESKELFKELFLLRLLGLLRSLRSLPRFAGLLTLECLIEIMYVMKNGWSLM